MVGIKLCLLLLISCCCNTMLQVDANDLQKELQKLHEKASVAFQQGKLDKAAKLFKKMDKKVGHLTSVGATNLAVVYRQQGKIDAAKKVYQKVVDQFPNDASVAIQYCRFAANLINNKDTSLYMPPKEAIETCATAAELDPKNIETKVLLGSVHVLLGQFDKSWVVLEEATKIADSAKNVEMYRQSASNLHLAYLRGNRPKQALKWGKKLYKKYGDLQSIKETYGHARTITLPYDTLAVKLGKESREQFIKGFNMKHPSCPSGKWNLAWNLTDIGTKTTHTDYEIDLLNPETAYTTFGVATDPKFPGQEIKPYYNQYHEHYIYKVEFPKNTYMWTRNGVIHSECSMIVGSQGIMWPSQEVGALPGPQYLATEEIDQAVVSTMPTFNPRNYYHWIVEGMVRLLYLEEEVLNHDVDKEYKILVPPSKAFIRDSLKLLGYDQKRILHYPSKENTMYKFTKSFVFVDWMGIKDDQHKTTSDDAWSPVYQPREGLLKIRKRFHNILKDHDLYSRQEPTDIVYISRGGANTGTRMIANEHMLISALKEAFGPRVKIHTGQDPLLDQISVFQKAALVIGAHGAGLANLVFMEKNTHMILFPMAPHVDHTYGRMAAALDIGQTLLPEIASYYYSNYGSLDKDQIDLVVKSAGAILGHDMDSEDYLESEFDDDVDGIHNEL